METEDSADGSGSAILPLTLNSADVNGQGVQTTTRDIQIRWAMTRPVDEGTRIVLLVLVTLLAIIVPLAVLAIVNWVLARFESEDGDARSLAIPVRLTADGPMRADGEPLLRHGDLSYLTIPPKARDIAGPGSLRLKASPSRSPFKGPSFRAIAAPSHRVVSGTYARIDNNGRSAPVTAGLGRTWVVSVSDEALLAESGDSLEVPAELVVILREYGPDLLAISPGECESRSNGRR